MPKYIGPYEIISCHKENSHYTLALPNSCSSIESTLRFMQNYLDMPSQTTTARFPNREATFFYDFGNEPEREWLIDSLVDHKFTGNSIQFNLMYYGKRVKLPVNPSRTARNSLPLTTI